VICVYYSMSSTTCKWNGLELRSSDRTCSPYSSSLNTRACTKTEVENLHPNKDFGNAPWADPGKEAFHSEPIVISLVGSTLSNGDFSIGASLASNKAVRPWIQAFSRACFWRSMRFVLNKICVRAFFIAIHYACVKICHNISSLFRRILRFFVRECEREKKNVKITCPPSPVRFTNLVACFDEHTTK